MSDDEVLRRLAALETENRSLRGEVDALRRAAEPPAPKPPKELPGQGPRPHGDQTGQQYCGAPSAPGGSSAGSGGFSSPWRKQPDGSKKWMPDNLPRDPVSGEISWQAAKPLPPDAGPQRTSMHQQQIAIVDQLFPIVPGGAPPTRDDE